MVEIISEDMMDWARDLAALRKLFTGEPLTKTPVKQQDNVIQFAEYQPQQRRVGKTADLEISVVISLHQDKSADESSIG